MTCKVCYGRGMIPSCPFCKKKGKAKRKTKLEKAKDNSLRERIKFNQLAFNNFKKVNADGSGVESFDQDVRDTIGDWK